MSHLDVAVAAALALLLVVSAIVGRSGWANVERDKAGALRRLVGRQVVVYTGTRHLQGYEGVIVKVDSEGCALRLSETGRERWLLLDNVSLVTEADGSVISSF